jgi:CcmD family protein
MSDNVVFLAVAYAVVWVIIAAYVWFVGHRQSVARKQLDTLKLEVQDAMEKLGDKA